LQRTGTNGFIDGEGRRIFDFAMVPSGKKFLLLFIQKPSQFVTERVPIPDVQTGSGVVNRSIQKENQQATIHLYFQVLYRTRPL
jgi:hypothetical protein